MKFSVRNDTIYHYLQDMAKHDEYWAYRFVAKHGRAFGPKQPLPEGVRRGPLKYCYSSAWNLTRVRKELIYVEGFARAILGVGKNGYADDYIDAHAWVVNARGEVIDPTWPHGIEYFGIPFKREYADKMMPHLKVQGCHSLILNDVDHFPLMTTRSTRGWLLKM